MIITIILTYLNYLILPVNNKVKQVKELLAYITMIAGFIWLYKFPSSSTAQYLIDIIETSPREIGEALAYCGIFAIFLFSLFIFAKGGVKDRARKIRPWANR